MYDVRLHVSLLIKLEILGFWKISRNRLADDELRPGDSFRYACFWVLEIELHGGTSLSIRRRLAAHPVFGVLCEWPGVDEHR